MEPFKGIVQRGAQRGSALGYPTINIELKATDVSGVYAALVRIDKTIHRAAAFADPSRHILEAYIFGISEMLYGREVTIELKHKIRETGKFENDELLKKAIAADITAIQEYFENMLKKLKNINYDNNKTIKRKDLSF